MAGNSRKGPFSNPARPHNNHIDSKPAFTSTRSIVSKQNCPGFNLQQFCLDTIELFVLKAGFEPIWLIGRSHGKSTI